MKKYKFLSILSALTMTAISVNPIFSSANFDEYSSQIEKQLEGYRLVDDKGVLETYAGMSDRDYYKVYIKDDFENISDYYVDIYVVNISEKDKNAYFESYCISGNDLLTMYDFYNCNYATIDEGTEVIQSYIDENNLDCTVVKNICQDEEKDDFSWLSYGYKVVPNSEITFEEYIDIAKQLKDGLGLVPYVVGGIQTSCFSIELESTIVGDVNLDGTVDVADVVAVASYAGDSESNSFKSEQQIINGDVHNKGDGLTANDALMIQQYLSRIIDSLE